MKVRIGVIMDLDIEGGSDSARNAVECSMAQFREQLEAVVETKLRAQFPDVKLTFGAEDGE